MFSTIYGKAQAGVQGVATRLVSIEKQVCVWGAGWHNDRFGFILLTKKVTTSHCKKIVQN